MIRLGRVSRSLVSFASLVMLTLLISSSCSPKETVKKTEEEVLRERVMAYWDYKIKGDFDKSYEFEDPYYRKKTSMVNYIRGFRTDIVQWKSVQIESVALEDNLATIDLDMRARVKLPQIKAVEKNSVIKDKWVRVDGIWYHVPETSGEESHN